LDSTANATTITFIAALVFDAALKWPVKETLMQLMALSRAGVVGPLPLAELALRTGKSVRTLYEHLRILQTYGRAITVLRSRSRGIKIELADWLLNPEKYRDSAQNDGEMIPQALIKKYEELTAFTLSRKIPPPTSENFAPNFRIPLSPELAQELVNAGVFSTLFTEVEASGCSEDYISALLAWCRHDYPERPGGLFMFRLRKRLVVPKSYYRTPCPACGQVGPHAPGCRAAMAESWRATQQEAADES